MLGPAYVPLTQPRTQSLVPPAVLLLHRAVLVGDGIRHTPVTSLGGFDLALLELLIVTNLAQRAPAYGVVNSRCVNHGWMILFHDPLSQPRIRARSGPSQLSACNHCKCTSPQLQAYAFDTHLPISHHRSGPTQHFSPCEQRAPACVPEYSLHVAAEAVATKQASSTARMITRRDSIVLFAGCSC